MSDRKTAALAALLAVLGGCAWFEEPPPPCPRIAIMDQAKSLTLYRAGAGRDLTDVTFELELVNVVTTCDYDFDDEDGDSVELEFLVIVEALRGPAAESASVTVPYFVAISDPARRIVAKEVFDVTLVFAENAVRARTAEDLEQRIPIVSGTRGPEYETFVGFQLSRAQLKDIRRLRAR